MGRVKNFLILLGKPIYLVLSYLVIGTLFVFYFIGRLVSRAWPIQKLVSKAWHRLCVVSKAWPIQKLVSKAWKKKNIVSRAWQVKTLVSKGWLTSFVKKFFGILVRFFKSSHEEIIYRAKDFRKKRKPKVFKIKVTFFRRTNFGTKLKILSVFGLIIFICGFSVWYFVFRGLPSPKELLTRKINVTTTIYDRNGVLLYQIYKDQNRIPVSLSQIPNYVRAATLASEEADFYTNPGFSIKGILRAIFNDVTKGGLSGGSTITQQLVKNTLLTPEKTLIRKIKEIILAVGVEQTFSKDKILEMYLNQVSYGGAAYGIQAASKLYFDKDVSELNLAEAAILAGLPKSPTTYSPFGANPDLSFERQKEVLRLMADNAFITKEEKQKAENEKITFAANKIDIKAPHFVMYVKEQLVEKYGEEIVESGGLTVTTTLDYNIQKMAEEVVAKHIDLLGKLHVTNGAAIVLDPKTGEILAMVGSKDYFDTKNDGNVNVITSLRPPGSSIKVVNYAYGLSHGFTAASILSDTPVKFSIPGQPTYVPVNYDGKFKGNITLRTALAESRNIPAVKLLASYGVTHMIELGQDMGITTWKDPSLYGISLTLGGGSTRLIDLARVYATVANLGVRPPIVSIKKVVDYKNNTQDISCDTNTCEAKDVLDPRVAYILIDILKDNNARAGEFGSRSALVVTGHPEVAVKTGTSNDLRDNLTIGFNQKYLTAVWVGNNDNSSMSRIASGITGAAPIWNEIMSRLLAEEKSISWVTPSGLISVPICSLTGTLSCEGCPMRLEWFLAGTQPKTACKQKEVPITQGQILDQAAFSARN